MVINYQVLPTKAEMNGLIAKVKKATPKFIGKNIIASSSPLFGGNINSILNWDSFTQTNSITNSYIQINFLNLLLHPTHYVLKGYNGRQYSKNWSVYGIDTSNNEILLSEDTSKEKGFCGTGENCNTPTNFLYQLKSTRNNLVAIKWVSTLGSIQGCYYFLTYGIELYGRLYSPPSKLVLKSCTRHYRNNIGLISLMIMLR